VIVLAALCGFVAGLAAMTLLLVVFRGRPVLVGSTAEVQTAVAESRPAAGVQAATDTASPVGARTETLATDAVRELQERRLTLPVAVDRSRLPDTFGARLGTPRPHEAMDVEAPRGTPVVAVEDGIIARLYQGTEGGTGLYQYDPSGSFAYYYAHLDRYAEGLAPGQPVSRGQVIGYVGTSGNVAPDRPQLHFAILALGDDRRWWNGIAVDPRPVLR
jgi:murein DD-endopeptidase MepM/ murein hydrolase activator NlpD